MQKLLLFILLLLSLKSFAQIDSALVDTVVAQKLNKYSIVVPFSADSLSVLPNIAKTIFIKSNTEVKSYFFLFLLNLLAISAMLLVISRSKVKKILGTLFSLNALMQYSKVETKRDNSYLWAYFMLFLIFLAAILYVIGLNIEKNIDVLEIVLLVFAFLTIDFFILFISAFIFKKEEVKQMCRFNNFSFVILMVPFFISNILLLLFLDKQNIPLYLSIMLAVITFSFLWKEFRNLLILKANRINTLSFYFFLYLCTFKILPFAIFVKIVIDEISKI